jgi:hypothetical protein
MVLLLIAQVRVHPGCELTVRRGRQTLAPKGNLDQDGWCGQRVRSRGNTAGRIGVARG